MPIFEKKKKESYFSLKFHIKAPLSVAVSKKRIFLSFLCFVYEGLPCERKRKVFFSIPFHVSLPILRFFVTTLLLLSLFQLQLHF